LAKFLVLLYIFLVEAVEAIVQALMRPAVLVVAVVLQVIHQEMEWIILVVVEDQLSILGQVVVAVKAL
jgi:hypothetical protein